VSFLEVILDQSSIADERDVGDSDGDARKDVVAVKEGDTAVQVFRAPTWTGLTLITFRGAHQYSRADDFTFSDTVGIRNRNAAPTWMYRHAHAARGKPDR
jgi:hypothetical protein